MREQPRVVNSNSLFRHFADNSRAALCIVSGPELIALAIGFAFAADLFTRLLLAPMAEAIRLQEAGPESWRKHSTDDSSRLTQDRNEPTENAISVPSSITYERQIQRIPAIPPT
jgi:hypothetical protein